MQLRGLEWMVGLLAVIQVLLLPLGAAAETESSILEQLDKLEEQLETHRKNADNLDKRRKALDAKLEESLALALEAEAAAKLQFDLLAQRMGEGYKLARAAKWEYLLSSRDFSDFVLRREYLMRVLHEDRRLFDRHASSFKEILARRRRIESEKVELDTIIASQKNEKKALTEQVLKKKAFLDKIVSEDRLRKQAEHEVAEAKRKLNRRVASLEGKPRANAGPAGKFAERKGNMPCPVKGRIEIGFGEEIRGSAKRFHGGWDLASPAGTSIRAPAAGKVVFAGRFRGFGNLLILDHGDKYYSLYGHLREINKAAGQQLRAGEIIGAVGDSGSLKGAFLYFELRHRGKPLDPTGWFACRP